MAKVEEKTRLERLAICRRCPMAEVKILGGTHTVNCVDAILERKLVGQTPRVP